MYRKFFCLSVSMSSSISSSPRTHPPKPRFYTPILQNTDTSNTYIPYTTLKSELSLLKTRITQLTSEKAALAVSLDAAEARARKSETTIAALEQKISNFRVKQFFSAQNNEKTENSSISASPAPSEAEGASSGRRKSLPCVLLRWLAK